MNSRSLVVLKFGGSVLADRGSIPAAVQEVSRHLPAFDRVIAVVSAFKHQTDALEQAAIELCPAPDPELMAFHMGLGEMHAAAEVTMGLQGAGISATLRMPWEVSFVSSGAPLDATPVSVSGRAFQEAFKDHRVVVFPGYIGRGLDGRPQVLGRGGSDLTAIFLAAELGANRCILLKNAPGIFEWDPASEGQRPRRYTRISWEDAERLGARVVKPVHLEYARSRAVTFEVTTLGALRSTVVGPGETEFETSSELERSQQGRRP